MLLDIITGIRIGVGAGIGLLVVGCIVVALAAFSAETQRRKQELVRFYAGTSRRRADLAGC
jgi:hypothetical protein